MIEEFIVKLEDGTEIRIAGELLDRQLPEDTKEVFISTLKTGTLEELLLKMSEQIKSMTGQIADMKVKAVDLKAEVDANKEGDNADNQSTKG